MDKSLSGEIRLHNEAVLSKCKLGDLLEFPRSKGYSHVAVYVGDGNLVHRTGDDRGIGFYLRNPSNCLSVSSVPTDKAMIKEESFWDVAGDSLAKINNAKDGEKTVLSGQEVAKRARSRLGEVGYHALSKNCEHFATWCRYGEEESQQVKNAVDPTRYIALLAPSFNSMTGLAALAVGSLSGYWKKQSSSQ